MRPILLIKWTFFFFHQVLIQETGNRRLLGVGVVEREYGNHAMPGWRKGTVGYHIDDGRIFDEKNPEKGVECDGKCLIHYSMKSDAVKVYHVEVH